MLCIENLSVYYDGLQSLDTISFEVEPKEMVCILGPNGAGKSTLLQTVAGMLTPRAGRVLLNNRPIHSLPPHEVAAAGVALVPEEGWLYPQMSVEENLLMGAFPKAARARYKRQMGLVYELFPRLQERKQQLSGTLSGGERQMLAVGRGLMTSPSVLMLDEPSLGLAPMVVKDILASLVRINREEQMTILLTEQIIFHALQVTQRGYLLENGRVAMSGPSPELVADPHIRKNYLGI